MSVTITQNKRYLVVVDSESVEASINFLKPFHVYKQQSDKIAIHDSTQIKVYNYNDVVTPGSLNREDLIAQLIEYNNNDHVTDSVNNLTVVAEEINVSVVGVEERIGNRDEVPAPTDTSTSGLNGLIKRLLQRVTEWISGQEDANNTLIDIMNNQVDGDQKTQVVDSGGTNIDFATEATLNNLKSFVESDSKFSDNTSEAKGTVNAVSFTFAAADTTRKQLIVVNTSTKKLWVSRNNPAIIGIGIPLNKEEVYIEDLYRGALYGIYESGTGNTYVIINDTE